MHSIELFGYRIRRPVVARDEDIYNEYNRLISTILATFFSSNNLNRDDHSVKF